MLLARQRSFRPFRCLGAGECALCRHFSHGSTRVKRTNCRDADTESQTNVDCIWRTQRSFSQTTTQAFAHRKECPSWHASVPERFQNLDFSIRSRKSAATKFCWQRKALANATFVAGRCAASLELQRSNQVALDQVGNVHRGSMLCSVSGMHKLRPPCTKTICATITGNIATGEKGISHRVLILVCVSA